MPLYIDGHLDLAFNVTAHDRDLTRDVITLRRRERRTKQELLVSLPELRRGHVGIAFGTLFTLPVNLVRPPGAPPLTKRQRALCYETPDQAHDQAAKQLALYERWEDEGRIRILRTRAGLEAHVNAWRAGDPTLGLVVLMEGADPVRTPDELSWWWKRGLRLLGPAWQRTRYSGGTSAPGPLTPAGEDLILAMRALGLPLDVSHMAEESFWGAMELSPEQVLASHSNARAHVPSDRQLTDEMIRALGERDAVIGLVLGTPLLKPKNADGSEANRSSLDDVRRHAEHIAGLVGWERLAIGSDFDGGFGVQETPRELTRGADFARLAEIAPPEARHGLLGGNWLRFLRRALPS